MKSEKIIVYITFITIFINLLILSCNLTNNNNPDPAPVIDYTYNPPAYISAEKQDGMVKIEWEQIPGTESYQLYKEISSGDLVKMDDGFIETNSFTYKEYNYNDDIAYAVRCWNDNGYSSDLSKCSNKIQLSKEEVMKALKPKVASFTVPGEIIITWEANPYATGYELYRYTEPDCELGIKVYEGDDLSYRDNEVTIGQFYYYKVTNKDRYKTYDSSPYAFGVTAYTGKDDYEDNENKDHATILEHGSTNEATIYYFKDSVGNNLIDYDWYYVQVPPHTEIPIIIEDFTHTLEDDDLFIAIGDEEKRLLKERSGYRLYNPGNTVAGVFFSITVNPEKFYNEYGGYTIVVEE